jgi:hypothetical protein
MSQVFWTNSSGVNEGSRRFFVCTIGVRAQGAKKTEGFFWRKKSDWTNGTHRKNELNMGGACD